MDSGTGLVEPQADYAGVSRRIHGLVGCLLDPQATVAVVSKGDQGLVGFEGFQGWHFPQAADGRYAGHHPADAAEVVAHLEQLRGQGADYFLLPATYSWWLDHYDAFARHLGTRYRLVADCPGTCLIYDLRAGPVEGRAPVAAAEPPDESVRNPLVPAIRALLDSLLPDREPVLVLGEREDFGDLGPRPLHFDLTAAREHQVKYAVLPATAGRGHLEQHGREVAIREGICSLYELV